MPIQGHDIHLRKLQGLEVYLDYLLLGNAMFSKVAEHELEQAGFSTPPYACVDLY